MTRERIHEVTLNAVLLLGCAVLAVYFTTVFVQHEHRCRMITADTLSASTPSLMAHTALKVFYCDSNMHIDPPKEDGK